MAVRGPFEAPLDPHLVARGTFVDPTASVSPPRRRVSVAPRDRRVRRRPIPKRRSDAGRGPPSLIRPRRRAGSPSWQTGGAVTRLRERHRTWWCARPTA